MTNKPLICCVVFIFLGIFNLKAQREINFQYDASGNRTERTIYLPPDNSVNDSQFSFNFAELKEDQLAVRDIKIYPNPTKGQLKVDISGIEFNSSDYIAIYSVKGSLLKRLSPVQTSNLINLDTYSSGIYIMIIGLNDETVKWKIVKQ